MSFGIVWVLFVLLVVPEIIHSTAIPMSSASSSPTSVVPMSTDDDNDVNNNHKSIDHFHDNPRSCILQVGVSAGRLCGVANTHMLDNNNPKQTQPPQSSTDKSEVVLVLAMSELLQDLLRTSQSLKLNIIVAIRSKMALNKKKYPAELCKGKAGRYTQYSAVTGITKTNQSTLVKNKEEIDNAPISLSELIDAVPDLATEILDFASERNWAQFHTPRNLVLALLGEVGELAELLQFKGDDGPLELSSEELDKLSQEVADVSIYLLRLATVCQLVTPLCEALQEANTSSDERR